MENEELRKDFWIEKLDNLLKRPELKLNVISKLEEVDPYFSTRAGLNDFTNAKRGKASVPKTARIVQTLQKYLDGLNPEIKGSKALKRQKLSL